MFSNALVHERNKVARVLEQVAPYRVISFPGSAPASLLGLLQQIGTVPENCGPVN